MGDVQFAGFWRRLGAFILDSLIYGIPLFLLKTALVGKDAITPLGQLVSAVVALIYTAYFLTSGWQATPGKRIMSIYVISQRDGGRINMATAFLRYLVLYGGNLLIEILAVCRPDSFALSSAAGVSTTLSPAYNALLGLTCFYMFAIALMVGLMEQKTGLHDLVAKTRVIHGRPVV